MKVIDFIKKYGTVGLAQLLPVESLLNGNANVFFVDSGATYAADDTVHEHGNSWETPFATISYAVEADLCTASNGDVILVAPGHTESITNATSVTTAGSCIIDIAGVNIIGLGTGSLIPTLTMTTATSATMSITAANCRVKNIKFVSGINNCAVAITAAAGADGLIVEDCQFFDTTTSEFLIGVSIADGCDDCRIRRNYIRGVLSNGATAGIRLVANSDDTVIEGNTIIGTYSVANINAESDPTASVGLVIRGNVLYNSTANEPCISVHTNHTMGAVVDNRLYGNCGTITQAMANTTLMCCGNFTTGVITASGILAVPAADS